MVSIADKDITVGTDAEGFFVDKETGKPVSSEKLIGGNKFSPVKVHTGSIQEDCVAWEINTIPISIEEGPNAFMHTLGGCINQVQNIGRKLNLEIDITPEKLFTKDQLISEQAQESGCSDTFCAWNLRLNKKVSVMDTNYRFASGDIHIGWPSPKEYRYTGVNIVRVLDITLGALEVMLEEPNKRVNSGYGMPGIHRPKPYGIEYKTISNFWIKDINIVRIIFKLLPKIIDNAVKFAKNNELILENSLYKNKLLVMRQEWNKDIAIELLHNNSLIDNADIVGLTTYIGRPLVENPPTTGGTSISAIYNSGTLQQDW